MGKLMPYVNIKITDEGVTQQQKQELISGITNLLVDELGKTRRPLSWLLMKLLLTTGALVENR